MRLAALHFNENSARDQACTAEGEKRFDLVFPKYKKGGYIVRKVTVDPTYGKYIVYNMVLNISTAKYLIRINLQTTSMNF